MPLLQRGHAPGGPLRLIRALGLGLLVALLASSCAWDEAAPADAGERNEAPTPTGIGPTWWFDAPCDLDELCMPPGEADPRPADLSAGPGDDLQELLDDAEPGSVVELAAGTYPSVIITTAGIVLRGAAECCAHLASVRVQVADVEISGVVIDTVVISRRGDRARLVASRVSQIFVNGADSVAIRGNVLRPGVAGPDVIQVKTFDGDTPVHLLIEGNVIGPQPSFETSHTDCIQILGGDQVVIARNVILPCGDKALQIRSGAGGVVGSVLLEANFILECGEQRSGCEGFHAIIWASTAEGRLDLRHNTIRGSVGISDSGSTRPPGSNFSAVGNIAATLPCTDGTRDNLTVSVVACEGRGEQRDFPSFVDDSETVGDLRLLDESSVPVAPEPFGPDIEGRDCATPRFGAATACPETDAAAG